MADEWEEQANGLMQYCYCERIWLKCGNDWKTDSQTDCWYKFLERVQRRATKFILNDYISSYKTRLQQLNLLPLMYTYELNDLMFLVKSLKAHTDNFDIKNFITFNTNSTRSGWNYVIREQYLWLITTLFQPYCKTVESSSCNKHIWTNSCYQKKNYKTSVGQFQDKLQFRTILYIQYYFLCPCHRCSRQLISSFFSL